MAQQDPARQDGIEQDGTGRDPAEQDAVQPDLGSQNLTADGGWEPQFLADLAAITPQDVPGLQLLMMAKVSGWFGSKQDPGKGYAGEHALKLMDGLFWALEETGRFTPEQFPEASENIETFWQQIATGSHELAGMGIDGIQAIISRCCDTLPEQLDANRGDADAQMTVACLQMLLVLAAGADEENTDEDLMASVVEGILEADAGWDALVAGGMAIVPPGADEGAAGAGKGAGDPSGDDAGANGPEARA